MRSTKLLIGGALVISIVTLANPVSTSASGFIQVASKNPYGGAVIDPLPITATIFTVTNGKKSITYSVESLLAIKSEKVTIFEPFIKRKQTFDAIPLSYFLKKSGITSKMKIDTIALNQYKYSNLASEFTSAHAYLAIRLWGKDIPYNQGGPIRIIFPTNSKWFENLDPWNWSLREIRVK
jgi:hypothetical protein